MGYCSIIDMFALNENNEALQLKSNYKGSLLDFGATPDIVFPGKDDWLGTAKIFDDKAVFTDGSTSVQVRVFISWLLISNALIDYLMVVQFCHHKFFTQDHRIDHVKRC